MKVLADEERANSKIVILGINKAGDALVQFAHDLNNRLEVIKFEANPIEKVQELLSLGETALNIELNVKDEIAESANGGFYIAQMLAHQIRAFSLWSSPLDTTLLCRSGGRIVLWRKCFFFLLYKKASLKTRRRV